KAHEGLVAQRVVAAQLEAVAGGCDGELPGDAAYHALLRGHERARQVVDGDDEAPGDVLEVEQFGERVAAAEARQRAGERRVARDARLGQRGAAPGRFVERRHRIAGTLARG